MAARSIYYDFSVYLKSRWPILASYCRIKGANKTLIDIGAWRISAVPFFPQRAILARFGRCAFHGCACHVTRETLLKYLYCLRYFYEALCELLMCKIDAQDQHAGPRR